MTERIQLPPIHRERLANGLQVVVASRPGVPLVAARLVFRGGSSLEPADRCGLAHLTALSARRGAGKRSGEQIDVLVESLGADVGAGVDEDASSVGLSAPVEALPRCLEVLGDVVTAPTFPPAEVGRLRRREVASLVHDLDEPAVVADRAMLAAAYGDHPYGHPPEGRARDLQRVGRGDIRAFHARQWRPAEGILLVVGAAPTGAVLQGVARRFARWRGPDGPAPELAPPAPPRPGVLVVDRPDLTQTQVRIVAGGFARRSPDYFPGMVASAVLGGGFTSRLMQEVRVNRGLSYGVRSRFATSTAGGLFYVSSFTKVETTAELVSVALEQMARFADEGPTAEELDRMHNYLCGLFPLTLETHEQVAERLADLALYGLEDGQVTEFPARVRAVSADACRDVARRYFPGDRPLVVVVGPAREVVGPLSKLGVGELRVVPVRAIT